MRWGFALFLGAAAALATLPDLVGLDAHSPFAQVIAFRPLMVAALGVLVVVGLLITLAARRFWPVPVVLALVALVGAAMVLPRTVADPAPTGGTPLKVLALNVYEGNADTQSLAALVAAENPDVVSIPEAGGRYESEIAPLLEPLGYRTASSVDRWDRDVTGNTVAWSDRLGDVRTRIGKDVRFDYIEITGGGLGNLRFVAFHSVAPVPRSVGQWRSDLETVAKWCSATSPAIVAGDFNASLDHSVFRNAIQGCGDAGSQTGNGLAGTWPTWAPSWLGPQIDHIVYNGGIAAESFGTRLVPGTDHRAIVATLRLP